MSDPGDFDDITSLLDEYEDWTLSDTDSDARRARARSKRPGFPVTKRHIGREQNLENWELNNDFLAI